ncbi:alpha/beta hydrolase [Kaistia algarum]|uniref:alpha/beta hydrolase n=1 Tax=Kaistia algarum TaxID=2083279 RepID=UPI002259D02B|nr:alpha/beta hydrolase [Kaistia algarum]MCX5512604.1 alpha/beta hydrolase [Kaistia algarum]
MSAELKGLDASRRGMMLGSAALLFAPMWLAGVAPAIARTGGAASVAREIPAHRLPVPDTISAELRPVVGAPLPPGWDAIPGSDEAWRSLVKATSEGAGPALEAIRQRLGVRLERSRIAGVPVFISTPDPLPKANRDRLLVHFHGGGYVLFPGEIGAGEGMLMAGYGRFRVISVDYRMPPDHPFPAALDDALAVWKSLLAEHDPSRMGMFGTSAGGGLTLATLLRAKAEKLPLPAVIAPGSPWVDLQGQGDSILANQFTDNSLVSFEGWVGAAAKLYAGSADLADPLISPIHGDFAGLPPAILTSGTRDLLLSDTVRTHRKLREAGIDAALQVFEAQSHAQFLTPFVPETAEAFGEIARFFDRHLAA